jgi:hypothetical protein
MTTTDTHKPSDPPMPQETGVAPQSVPPRTEKHVKALSVLLRERLGLGR